MEHWNSFIIWRKTSALESATDSKRRTANAKKGLARRPLDTHRIVDRALSGQKPVVRRASFSHNSRWYSKTVGCVIVELLIDRDKFAEMSQLVCLSAVRERNIICMYCLECKSVCLYIYVYVRDCVCPYHCLTGSQERIICRMVQQRYRTTLRVLFPKWHPEI